MNIRTCLITPTEIKNAIKKLNSGKAAGSTIYHQRQSRLLVRFQRRFSVTFIIGCWTRKEYRRRGKRVC